MHDSCIAEWGSVYDTLETMYESPCGRIVVDSAFAHGQCPFLIKSAQHEQETEGAHDFILMQQATSVFQASE